MKAFIMYPIMLVHCIQMAWTDHAYFQYASDCPSVCVAGEESCSVEEPTPDNFEKACYTYVSACVARASPECVCMQAYGPPKGGQSVWPAYKRHFYPEPSPSPPPRHGEYLIYVLPTVTFIIGILVGALAPYLKCRSLFRRREYEHIPSGSGVYASTTVPILNPSGGVGEATASESDN